ncbi:Leucine-rich repeat receptor-like serine/threonine-protein kinase BAM1 [Platanthera zijinensis]|uniref:Leucine-rich repeat receptor-like serine/threonine-protein kinase BAM1 n=1 Tax=Platanthera zijinensis TaxID=2320716 RepID=A0AAP0G616_9ASPA
MDAELKPHVLFFIFFSLAYFIVSYSQSPRPDEKQILLNLKNAWGSPASLMTWNSAGDHCQYAGISCSGEGYVVGISLYNSNISFPIPSFICDLKALTSLNLSYNYVPGEFPSFLYNCSSLQKLDISDNYFVGELPADINRMPQNLTHLVIGGNNFTGDIPAAIGRFPAIKYLDLNYNLFNGTIPAEIGNLSTLESLILAQNPFPPTKIPPEFGNLTSIKYIWMSKMNLFGEIPESLGKLANLEHLNLGENSLVGNIPASIWMIKPLKVLYLFKNKLAGEISKTVAADGLSWIDLSSNQLTGSIPEAFGELKNLSILYLYFNSLSGKFPASIARLSNLYDIRIFNNSIEGVLPPEMGKYSRLWNFEVDDNMFTGELPDHLCDGNALTGLIVFDNQLTGELPKSLGSCDTLLNVQLQNNLFTGEFPAGIWSAINLTFVAMQGNRLTGTLPERLPWNLTRLVIQNNLFSGRIPLSAGGLLVFNGDRNNFSGEIPASFFENSMFQSLTLSGNHISGNIPATVGSMTSLSVLDLSNNLLAGAIPESLGSLPLLNSLDLSKNKLSGEIPSKLGDLKLNYLNLSVNALTGEIPAPLQIQAFEYSFRSNQNLCAADDRSFPYIQSCRNSSASSDKLSASLLILFIALGALLISGVMLICFLIIRAHRRRKNAVPFPTDWKTTSFQVVDVSESAIFRGLTEENIIGRGGGGKVYSVSLAGGIVVAVKKIWNARKLDSHLEKEFQAEVKILGSIRHANIVKLLCCISGRNSKLLVYEYLHNGSLDGRLHRRKRGDTPPLDWQTRLQIAVGAAKGLCYMHHGCSPPIIHRDVKSSNILLDPQFNSKIADFGLARILAKGGEPETVSAVAGSFGYMAPECGALRKVNEKVDVYSFGVVLLELVTGREAGDGGEEDDGNLTDWAWRRYKESGWTVADAVDEEIAGDSSEWVEEAEVVFRMGLICTGWDPASRPTMKEVLQVLMKLGRGREVIDGIGGAGETESDLLQSSKGKSSSRRKKIADVMDDSDDSGVGRYAGIDSLL